MGAGWTDDRIEQLKKLWQNDYSASEIANVIGGTRNAIIGKLHRLGMMARKPLPAHLKPIKPRKKLRRGFAIQQTLEVVPPRAWVPRVADIAPLNIELLALGPGQCRFTASNDAPFFFCGHVQAAGSSYCPAHRKICTPRVLELSETERDKRRERSLNTYIPHHREYKALLRETGSAA